MDIRLEHASSRHHSRGAVHLHGRTVIGLSFQCYVLVVHSRVAGRVGDGKFRLRVLVADCYRIGLLCLVVLLGGGDNCDLVVARGQVADRLGEGLLVHDAHRLHHLVVYLELECIEA